jgi:hypothetical protein
MKVILSESRFDSVFSEWLKKEDIKIRIEILNDINNKFKLVVVFMYLTHKGEPLGNPGGHIFSFNLVDDKLIVRDSPDDIMEIGLFTLFPNELVIKYFTEKVKEFIYKTL